MTARPTRSEKLDIRLTREAKHILSRAAAAERRSLSDFVLASALSRAEEALADRHVFKLDGSQWDAFVKALDAPPRELPRMQRLLREPGVFSNDDAA